MAKNRPPKAVKKPKPSQAAARRQCPLFIRRFMEGAYILVLSAVVYAFYR